MDVAERDKVGTVGSGGDCEDETLKRLTSKNLNITMGYLTSKARLAFNKLKKAFTKAPILQNFDPECHIQIETGASGYAIGRVLSQQILNNLGWWHLITFYSQKMIPAKTRHKTPDNELLAIVEAFKTLRHYLKDCKHKGLMLTNHNNLCCFMNTKSLSSRQVCWA